MCKDQSSKRTGSASTSLKQCTVTPYCSRLLGFLHSSETEFVIGHFPLSSPWSTWLISLSRAKWDSPNGFNIQCLGKRFDMPPMKCWPLQCLLFDTHRASKRYYHLNMLYCKRLNGNILPGTSEQYSTLKSQLYHTTPCRQIKFSQPSLLLAPPQNKCSGQRVNCEINEPAILLRDNYINHSCTYLFNKY